MCMKRVLINKNNPDVHIRTISNETAIVEKDYGCLLIATTESFGQGQVVMVPVFFTEPKENYYWKELKNEK